LAIAQLCFAALQQIRSTLVFFRFPILSENADAIVSTDGIKAHVSELLVHCQFEPML